MTKEQELVSKSNWRKARKYFGLKSGDKLILHHINPEWKTNNIERYIQWNPEDLVVMTQAEHASLHHKGVPKGPITEEHRQKLKESHLGNHSRPLVKVRRVEDGMIFNSIKEAALAVGAKGHSNISSCCRGIIETSMGYHWEYV